jgi:ubiquinone/menaquinone biosynthesis C-methylase UbiE
MNGKANIDLKTVEGFGEEWTAFDQFDLDEEEQRELFEGYFRTFPFDEVHEGEGFDLGCGSGRWALLAAQKVRKLHCIDPSAEALMVARRRLVGLRNVEFHHAGVDDIPLDDETQDFGYSLGVLHHIPDTQAAMEACVRKLKPGAPFLVYLYYNFDNRSAWFRALWRVSEFFRLGISHLPFPVKRAVTTALAAGIYWPLARAAWALERGGRNIDSWPLSAYRNRSFYSMKTDSLDRFGTRLEQRFSRAEIAEMMRRAGLKDIVFSDWGHWVACGRKA